MENAVKKNIHRLKEIDSEVQKLTHIAALLSWDQETYMPSAAVEERSEQLSLIQGLIHDSITSAEAGELLGELGFSGSTLSGPDTFETYTRAFLREFFREYRRKTRLPKRLVTELAKQTSISQMAWVRARKTSDFPLFAPHLQTILKLVTECAECLGYKDHIYDPLLDEYEPWMKTSELEDVFSGFEKKLKNLLTRIVDSGKKVDTELLKRKYRLDNQRAFSMHVLKTLGYDFERGRLDQSAHPFTTTLGCSDVRLTTRYDEKFFNTGIFGTIHEAGHGLYEQGVDEKLHGTLLSDGTSMGIHESQSRMWENLIGRSLPFWKHFYPGLKELFSDALDDVRLKDFYRGINAVVPSLIRVEADEVTYNLHIFLRYNLEKRLLTGELAVNDLPEAWSSESNRLLGITPEHDAQGVLQDIHWSVGLFGYFPTYSLGNLYSAQFFKVMQKDLSCMESNIESGVFKEILGWLRENIHKSGRIYSAGELCKRVTGETLNPNYFMEYLENKYAEIYGI